MRMPAVAHVSKAGKQAVSSSLAWPARELACFYSRNRLQAPLAKADRPALPALALEDTVLTGAFSTECAPAGIASLAALCPAYDAVQDDGCVLPAALRGSAGGISLPEMS